MGKITKIEIQKRNKNRVNIYIDEVYSFAVSTELVYKQGLKTNMEVDEEKLQEVAEAENLDKCKNTALRIIEKSYKTELELKDKLKEKGYDEKAIKYSIDFLKEYKFIDDIKYAEMYIKDRLRNSGVKKIKYSLIRKGVSEDIIDEVLNNVDTENQKNVAIELTEKKYNQLIKRGNDQYKIKNKVFRFLQGKGYEYSLITEVINQVINVDEFD